MGIRILLLAVVACLVQISLSEARAQTEVPLPARPGGYWHGAAPGRRASPDQQCQADRDAFNATAILSPPTRAADDIYECHWKNVDSTVAPASAVFSCDSGILRNGDCVERKYEVRLCDRCQDPSRPLLGSPGFLAGDPVSINSGLEVRLETDYESGDGLLKVDRRYVSSTLQPFNFPFPGFGEAWQGLLPGRLYFDLIDDSFTFSSYNGIKSLQFGTNYAQQTSFDFTRDESRRSRLTMVTIPQMSRNEYFIQPAVANGPGEMRVDFPNGDYILFRRSGYSSDLKKRFAVPVERGSSTGYKIYYDYPNAGFYPNVIRDNRGRQLSLTWEFHNLDPWVAPGLTTFVPGQIFGVISAITLPDGGVINYSYDASNFTNNDGGFVYGRSDRLKEVVRKTAANVIVWKRSYLYENARLPYALTGVLNQNGQRISTVSYDQTGLVSSTELAGGLDRHLFRTYQARESDGWLNIYYYHRDVTNPLGLVSKYSIYEADPAFAEDTPLVTRIDLPAIGNLPATATKFDGNYVRLVASTTPRGIRTEFDADGAALRPSVIREAVGLGEQRTTQFTWHATLDVPLQAVRPGLTTSYTYGVTGQPLTVTQTDTTTQTAPYSTQGQTRTWTYVWNANGTLASVNGPKAAVGSLDDIVTFGYDANGNTQTVTNALGQVTSFSGYDANGRPATMIDPGGVVTNISYDDMGRTKTLTVKHPSNATLDAVTQMEYDVEGRVTGLQLPATGKLFMDYDLAGRMTALRTAAGERIDYAYNAMGGAISETTKRASGTTRSSLTRSFDQLNRVVQVAIGPGRTQSFEYDADGNVNKIQGSRSNATTQAFDGLNRLVGVIASDAGSTTNTYDVSDGLKSTKDPIAVTTTFVRNGFGEVISETSPDRGTTVYYRDASGDVTAVIDGRGQRVDLLRDMLGRVTKKTPVSRPASEVITYVYDGCGLGSFLVGRLGCATDGTGTISFEYDFLGNLIRKRQPIGQTAQADFSYVRDKAGRITQITYPSGLIVSYTRDSNGLITSISSKASTTASSVNLASSLTYEAFGPLSGLIYGNGTSLAQNWEAGNRLSAKVIKRGTTTLWSTTYQYDNDDNIVGVTDLLDSSKSVTYAYDGENRLTQTTGNFGTTHRYDYAFDKNGNRSGLETRDVATQANATTTTPYALVSGTNRLATVGATAAQRAITYDARGNTLTETRPGSVAVAVTYDGYARLTGYTRTGQPAQSSVYNGMDDRIAVTTTVSGTSVTRRYLYDPGGRLMGDYGTGAADVKGEFIWLEPELAESHPTSGGDGQDGYGLLAVSVGAGASQVLQYVHTNHLGTPVLTTNSTGVTVTPGSYAAVGFPGQTRTLDDLYYNRYRDYDPTIGRYIQADPIGLGGGQNNYAYAANNPMRWIDPWGLAQFGLRPLGDGAQPFPSGKGPDSPNNFSLAHDDLWFDDNPADNVGFFNKEGNPLPCGGRGEVRPDRGHSRSQYRFYGPKYDDKTMRQAVKNIAPQWNNHTYCVAFQNCQNFADALRAEYYRLQNQR